MLWSSKDEETVRQCRECVDNCKHYHTRPAPWFELLLRMHRALEEAGMLETQEFGVDFCEGCVHSIGGCRKAYREAELDEERKRVVACRQKTTEKQKAALTRAAERKKRNLH